MSLARQGPATGNRYHGPKAVNPGLTTAASMRKPSSPSAMADSFTSETPSERWRVPAGVFAGLEETTSSSSA